MAVEIVLILEGDTAHGLVLLRVGVAGRFLLLMLLRLLLLLIAAGRLAVATVAHRGVAFRWSFHRVLLLSDGNIFCTPHLRHKVLVTILGVLTLHPGDLQEVLAEGENLTLVARLDQVATL